MIDNGTSDQNKGICSIASRKVILDQDFLDEVSEVQKEAEQLLHDIRAEIQYAESSLDYGGYFQTVTFPWVEPCIRVKLEEEYEGEPIISNKRTEEIESGGGEEHDTKGSMEIHFR